MDQGYDVTVLAPEDNYVGRLQSLGVSHRALRIDNKGTNPVTEARTLFWLIETFRRERPAVVLTFTPKINIYCGIAARLTGATNVANVSGLGSGFLRGGWIAALMNVLYRLSFAGAFRVFFQNEDDRALFVRKRIVEAAKAVVLPGSGVDTHRFSPRPPGAAAGRRFKFLLIARLLSDKGVREYVRAGHLVKRRFPGLEISILGAIDERNPSSISRDELEQWVRSGDADYLGVTDDVRNYIADSDCVVLPSYREGCPRTLLEAASMGKPVIASDVPGCRQVVDDGVTGYLVRVRDVNDLAEKMITMASSDERYRTEMGNKARKKMIDHFDERIVIDSYLSALREVVDVMTSQVNLKAM